MTTDHPMRELRKNMAAYETMRERLEREHQRKTVLLHDGKLIHILNDRWDAYVVGMERFGAGCFSIKTIGQPPASLGAATYGELVSID